MCMCEQAKEIPTFLSPLLNKDYQLLYCQLVSYLAGVTSIVHLHGLCWSPYLLFTSWILNRQVPTAKLNTPLLLVIPKKSLVLSFRLYQLFWKSSLLVLLCLCQEILESILNVSIIWETPTVFSSSSVFWPFYFRLYKRVSSFFFKSWEDSVSHVLYSFQLVI